MCFAFYAEIQDGHQKMAGKWFLQNVASTLCRNHAGPKFCRNLSISHRFQDECAFALYAKIQDGCQKWQESDFCEKVASRLCIYLVGQKFRQNRSITHRFRDKFFKRFMQKFKMATKNGGKVIFVKSHQYTLDTLGGGGGSKISNKIALSGTVKEIEANLCFCILAVIFRERKIF